MSIHFVSVSCVYYSQGSIAMSQKKKAVSASQNKTQRVRKHIYERLKIY